MFEAPDPASSQSSCTGPAETLVAVAIASVKVAGGLEFLGPVLGDWQLTTAGAVVVVGVFSPKP